jgi:hypothetical protein
MKQQQEDEDVVDDGLRKDWNHGLMTIRRS